MSSKWFPIGRYPMYTIMILISLIRISQSEDWYMPDSNLISNKQFEEHVQNDPTSFKFVKYFIPSCGYCRYLKIEVDRLKHQRQWCFKFFDLNCNWYPQFCSTHLNSGSFPYVGIYDLQGKLESEIHGYYPYEVLKEFFQQLQDKCVRAKQLKQSANNPVPKKESSLSSNSQPQSPNVVEPVAVQPVNTEPEIKNQIKNQTKQSNQQPAQEPQARIIHQNAQQVKAPISQPNSQSHSQASHENPKVMHDQGPELHKIQQKHTYLNYLFYAVCLGGAAYYVYTLHKTQDITASSIPNHHHASNAKTQQSKQTNNKNKEQMANLQQNELLSSLQDEQL